jgi:ubiquinone/menaquinone biosynthesis C-methylase UbiE
MNEELHSRVCPAELSGSLDNSFRRIFQNPVKILKPFIEKGMTVLDLGCGPGFFSIDISKMVTSSGKVISADLQEKMLERINRKITGTDSEKIIELHKCETDKVGVTEKVDFVLAFWMIHEVPDKQKLFIELKSILKSAAKILIVEPKFHVKKDEFENMIKILEKTGFEIIGRPGVSISRAVLLSVRSFAG